MIQNSELPKWKPLKCIEKFDDLKHDVRFFAIITKGLLSWLNTNILLYNKSVRHFIISTGTEYLYQEANGYNFSWTDTTGEDMIYNKLPRCVLTWDEIKIITGDLSSPYARGSYERTVQIDGYEQERSYNAEIKLMPIEMPIKCEYVLSNFNEQLILTEELLSEFAFTRYFSVSYMGNKIDCSLEFPTDVNLDKPKITYSSENSQNKINLSLALKTTFPVINPRTEVYASKTIYTFTHNVDPQINNTDKLSESNNTRKI
jgi:hypothetical protein